ncbi:MAG: hypothetical protein EXR98_20315 [Gemmataceae bacterium]|nr:hypothetical protein [Gemmataceae bacterium]
MALLGLAIAVLPWSFAPAGAVEQDEKSPPKPLPEKVVSVWEEAGAQVGWMRLGRYGYIEFQAEAKPQFGDVPAFQFEFEIEFLREGVLKSLPSPPGPFGLDLNKIKLADADLKELAGFKNLQILKLSGRGVSDAGLKDL